MVLDAKFYTLVLLILFLTGLGAAVYGAAYLFREYTAGRSVGLATDRPSRVELAVRTPDSPLSGKRRNSLVPPPPPLPALTVYPGGGQ